MKAQNIHIEALHMQIMQLVTGIRDKAFLLGIREELGARFPKEMSQEAEITDLEMASMRKGMRDIEAGRVRTTEEVQSKMRAKLRQ